LPLHAKPTFPDRPDALIARDAEMALLANLRRKAAGGHGGIVLIAGEAGVGKSRLLRQFRAEAGSGRASAAFARCVEFVQTPLAPLRELLQGLERGGQAGRDGGTRSLVERLTFEREADALTPRPAGWLFESIDAAFARAAARGTSILFIEDLHWADRSTLGFLTYLADRIADRRMLVVATYRSDDVDHDQPRLAGLSSLLAKEHVETLSLRPLDERATHALVEQVLPQEGALDAATLAAVVRRSRGNPFFAEELVKSALAGRPADEGERLPLSIRGAVLARVGLLSDEERGILSLAAVLGERFAVERLVTIAEAPRSVVLRALERARRLQLVDDRPAARGELVFRHALTQEVLYGELLAERVRPLHEAIGLELEARPDRSAASVELAYHWWRAGDGERAATYAELAGDRAYAIGAIADAISYYERALAARRGSGVHEAALEEKVGLSLGAIGRLAGGIERLRRASDLYWAAGAFESFANSTSALGAQLYNSGDPPAAIDLYRRTIDALGSKLPAPSIDLLRGRTAFNCVAALDFDAALTFVREITEPITDPETAVHAYQARFKVAAMRGDVAAWRENCARAFDAAQRMPDDVYRLNQTQCQIGLDALGLGEVETAGEHFAAAIAREGAPNLPNVTLALALSALEHTLRGDFAAAAGLLARVGVTSEHNYAVMVHVKVAQYVYAVCTGDDARLRNDDAETYLHYGVEHGMKLATGLLGGPYAWALGVRGDTDAAASWVRRLTRIMPGPHRFAFAFLAGAQFGVRNDVLALRQLLEEAAARPQDRVNKAVLGMFDAFAAQRGIGNGDAKRGALDAARRFEEIGWPWLAARSYELGGDAKRALEAYRALGALRDLRRMEAGRSDPATAVLSPREREVAELVAAGHSNDEVAQALHISPRTVEKHVSSALDKLQLRSRVQLGQVLAGRQ
jgi:DNA-binding CsgD family transcriptional regulator/tetratricopeptide (TPR) repeat protein